MALGKGSGDGTMKLDELGAYVKVLAAAMDRTQHAEDRPRYEAHLAAAARMFAAILAGDEGERAHAAWATFETAVVRVS